MVDLFQQGKCQLLNLERYLKYRGMLQKEFANDPDLYQTLGKDIQPLRLSLSKWALRTKMILTPVTNDDRRDYEYFLALTPERMMEGLSYQIKQFMAQTYAKRHDSIPLGFTSKLSYAYSEFRMLVEADSTYHQAACDLSTLYQRTVLVDQYKPKSILLVGDDDLLSVPLKTTANSDIDVTVVDIDPRIIDYHEDTSVKAYRSNVFEDRPPAGNYDAVFMDPYYEIDAMLRFISYGLIAMRDRPGTFFLCMCKELLSPEDRKQVDTVMAANGFKLRSVHLGVNYYPMNGDRTKRYKRLAAGFAPKSSRLVRLAALPGFFSDLFVYQRQS